MIDVVVVANDLKSLTGTATEGLPFEIEDYTLHPNAKNKEKILKKFEKIKIQLNNLQKEVKSDEAKIQSQLIFNMFQSFFNIVDGIDAKLDTQTKFEEINQSVRFIKEASVLIGESIERLISVELKYDEESKKELAQNADRNGMFLLASIFIIGIFSVASFYFIFVNRNILSPLNQMKKTMELITKDMSNIHLRVKIDNDDEIGVLGKYFNEMADQIQENQLNLETLIEKRTNELESSRALNIQSSKLAALGEMAGGIAHEINTPLAAILLNAEMIISENESLTQPNQAIEKQAQSISGIVFRISKIINGLKIFSRDASKDSSQTFTVGKLIESTLDLCTEKFKSNNIQLIVKEEFWDAPIYGQIVHLSQTLLNLLNNSFDAIQELQEKWIQIEVLVIGQFLELSITDSGPGIAKDVVEKMFQPFYTTKDIGKGTGLGLGISIGIVQTHGGTLFYDEKHKNTRFVIRLPISQTKGH